MEAPGEIEYLTPDEISSHDWESIRNIFHSKLEDFQRYGGDKDQFFILALKTAVREHQLMRLATLAERDPLMPYIFNRLGSINNLGKEIPRYKREMKNGKSKGLTVICGDMDNFKAVNDLYGHAVGDGILRYAACTMLECLRATDAVGRLGGDEFQATLPDANIESGEMVGQRIISSFNSNIDYVLSMLTGKPLEEIRMSRKPSISLGLAPYSDQSAEELMDQADTAMLNAKERGKNTIVKFESGMVKPPSKPR